MPTVVGNRGVEVRGLSWSYGSRTALDGVDLSVQSGRFTVLLGPNGAGKSTLVALLSGLIVARHGRITIRGYDMFREPRAALAVMGFVFQQQTLDLDLTVTQNMAYFAAIRGMTPACARSRIAASLERMGLAERAHETAGALNGGHRRRLEIARALLHEPAVLILDEPTSGLDVPSRGALVQHVHALCTDEGLTVLWATHLVDEVWVNDDLIVLADGRVREQGAVREVLTRAGCESVLEAFSQLTTTPGGSPAGAAGSE